MCLIPGPEVIKLFLCTTQPSTKFQLLINTKILTNKEVSCFNPLVPKHRMYYQKTFIFHPDTSFGKSNRKQGLNLC